MYLLERLRKINVRETLAISDKFESSVHEGKGEAGGIPILCVVSVNISVTLALHGCAGVTS